ncbi:TauD/TfdA family dioxygenase [Mesorhizobium sp. CA18]|nr:TauD/TfdA family dioxygenase [Mesorhizobium sp. CA9]MBZ9824647.1 TauD/TfdA family dioxygenase [Mesorhizobium sp. CA18]MBZ9829395.1 TauD/TfdA family dioxygenase [Mesorhizobium sp. CA2]MBZ9878015.1 TauD/TfdA family dioxygenase [Mesorhizobium sp. Ca11]MBZ9902893.1 TauD/TfdA family dioxygenase [Mesorhizobium sp. CA17]
MRLIEALRAEIKATGFVFIERFLPNHATEAVAATLGTVLNLGTSNPVHRLAPRDQGQATPNTYSGNFGLEAFPFHTDLAHWRMPPRYFMLRCIVGFAEVPTLLLDGRKLVEAVGRQELRHAIVRPRRRVKGELPLLRLCQDRNGEDTIRWDSLFLVPASEAGKSAIARFAEAVAKATSLSFALSDPSDTLIVDNWRMLHARAAIRKGCEGRLIERIYLGDLL